MLFLELFPFVELRSTGRANAPVPTRTLLARDPLRGRLPLELSLDFFFLFPIYQSGAEGAMY